MSLIQFSTKIHFADDVLEEALEVEAGSLGLQRPLLVVDRSAAASGIVDRLFDALRARSATLFAARHHDATETDARAAADLYHEEDCDGLIAAGTGAAIDLAKAVAVLVTHTGPLLSYAASEGGIARIRGVLPPLIAVPTASGSGTEVARSGAIVFSDGRRLQLVSPYLIPRVAICDPVLTLGTPPEATAQGGMDALTHCIETYVATGYNPPADAIALDGVRRASTNLRRAVDDGSDLEARREMMAAAIEGALALQKGLGGVHAMSYALEGLQTSGPAHGALNAILLPHVLDFNAPAVAHRYDALESAVGGGPHRDLPDAIRRLGAAVGLPPRLSALGLDDAAIGRAAPLAVKDHTSSTNPRRAGAADYLGLMRAAL